MVRAAHPTKPRNRGEGANPPLNNDTGTSPCQPTPTRPRPPPRPDSGIACLAMLACFHGISVEPAQLAHEFGDGRPFGTTEILLAAKKLGIKAKQIKATAERLPTTPLPALALDKQGGFFILARFDDGQALIHDPARSRSASNNSINANPAT